MKEQENSINELCTGLKAAKENIVGKDKENQDLLETLNRLWDNCFSLASRCCDTMKKIFSSVGATLRASLFTSEDIEGVLGWIKKELGEVETIISARSDYCAMIRSRGMASVLKKAGCEHVKAVGETDFGMAVEDIKTPSKSVLGTAKRFFFELWDKGGRQLAALEAEAYTRKSKEAKKKTKKMKK